MRNPSDQCARCWARNGRPCEVCNYPLDRIAGEDNYPTPHPIPEVRLAFDVASTGRTSAAHPNRSNVRPGRQFFEPRGHDWVPESRNYLAQSLMAEEFALGLHVVKAKVRDKQRARKALRLFKTAKTTEAGEHYFWLYYRYLGGTPLY